ncbi:MAG: hypothetical protein RLZZ245_1978 [Verrucomicrobiota bacterium]|jgi:hypothetical protein
MRKVILWLIDLSIIPVGGFMLVSKRPEVFKDTNFSMDSQTQQPNPALGLSVFNLTEKILCHHKK